MATTETQDSSEVGSDPVSERRKWLRRAVIVGVILTAAGLVTPAEIEMELTQLDGSKRLQIMIPWTGAFADKIQQVE